MIMDNFKSKSLGRIFWETAIQNGHPVNRYISSSSDIDAAWEEIPLFEREIMEKGARAVAVHLVNQVLEKI
jgi:hypothetical protein